MFKKLIITILILVTLSLSTPVFASTIPDNIPTYDYYRFTVLSITPDYIIAHPINSDTLYTFPMDYMRDGDTVHNGDSLGVVIDPSHHDSDNDMGLINIERYRP